jgi:hypothetical protein
VVSLVSGVTYIFLYVGGSIPASVYKYVTEKNLATDDSTTTVSAATKQAALLDRLLLA